MKPQDQASCRVEVPRAEHVVRESSRMLPGASAMTAEKASTAMAACVSRVLLESSQMRTGVRVLRALLAGLESEVAAKHAPPGSSRTMQ